jgi:hypothetical protein
LAKILFRIFKPALHKGKIRKCERRRVGRGAPPYFVVRRLTLLDA